MDFEKEGVIITPSFGVMITPQMQDMMSRCMAFAKMVQKDQMGGMNPQMMEQKGQMGGTNPQICMANPVD
eukprot:11012846-Heterocapsa_arctica.AAC.1